MQVVSNARTACGLALISGVCERLRVVTKLTGTGTRVREGPANDI
jgi:hypothetical protein